MPNTFTFGLLSIFFSLFKVKIASPSFSSATGFSTASSLGASTGFSTFGSDFGATGFGALTFFSGSGLTAAAFTSGAFFSSGAADFLAEGALPMLSRSIFPIGLYTCWLDDSSKLSARLSFASGVRFFSLGFFWNSFSASLRTAASCLNASTSA